MECMTKQWQRLPIAEVRNCHRCNTTVLLNRQNYSTPNLRTNDGTCPCHKGISLELLGKQKKNCLWWNEKAWTDDYCTSQSLPKKYENVYKQDLFLAITNEFQIRNDDWGMSKNSAEVDDIIILFRFSYFVPHSYFCFE